MIGRQIKLDAWTLGTLDRHLSLYQAAMYYTCQPTSQPKCKESDTTGLHYTTLPLLIQLVINSSKSGQWPLPPPPPSNCPAIWLVPSRAMLDNCQPANILPSWQRCQIRRRQEKKVGRKKKKKSACVFVCLPLFVLKEYCASKNRKEEEGTLRLSETFFSWWQRDELLHTELPP